MRCRRCGFELKGEWEFCPRCGARKGSDMFDVFGRDLFSQIFSQMKRSFGDIEDFERMFEKDIEALDLSPWFRRDQEEGKRFKPIQGKGFSIHITTGTGMKPKVNIKTYGDVNKERIEKELQEKLGVKRTGIEEMPRQERMEEKKPRFSLPSLSRKTVPKCTEEPKAEVRRIGDKVTVDICMPGVKSTEEVEIKDLESSVEVKAVAEDKAYFKILTKPAQFRLTGKSFKDGTLHLEFS